MDFSAVSALAEKYSDQAQNATSLSIAVEPEPQLMVPLANFSAFAVEVGLGRVL